MSKQTLLDYIDKYRNHPDFKYLPSSFWSLNNLLEEIYRQADLIKAKTIVELGTDSGSSTIAFLSVAADTGGTVYSIDMAPCDKAKQVVKDYGLEEHWVFSQMDSRIAASVWGIPVDLLFIDTDHTYESTKKEMETWIPWVRKGGVILFHDVISRKGEVQVAIDDFLKRYDGLFSYEVYGKSNGPTPDPYGLGIMRKL